MKSITIVNGFPYSEPVVSNRLNPMIKVFLNKGYKVNLVYPVNNNDIKTTIENVNVYEVYTNFYKPNNHFQRVIKETMAAVKLLKKVKKIKSDICLVSLPPILIAYLAPFILVGAEIYYDIRDLVWEYLDEKLIINRIVKKAMENGFKFVIKFVHGISVSNPSELQYLKEIYKGKTEPVLVTNGISENKFIDLGKINEGKTRIVVYSGNVGLAQGLDTLIMAAKLLPEIKFLIVGDGVELVRVKKIALDEKINNVSFFGRKSWDEVCAIYDKAQILYAQLKQEFSTAMPSKLYEYLATGKYIIYGGQGSAANILSEFEHNTTIPPSDVCALVEAIQKAFNKKNVFKLCNENRNKIKEKYLRENSAKLLVNLIDGS